MESSSDVTESKQESKALEPTKEEHTHSFNDATCTEPKTCSCGATDGDAKGHSWTSATCSAPKKCTVCGIEEGNAVSHNFSGGKCVYCETAEPNVKTEETVWIPASGTKYHSNSSCSGMKNPQKVTVSEAENRGYTPCKKCY